MAGRLPWSSPASATPRLNHSTAAGALNTASYCAYQGLPLPLLLVCEDNGLGISVRTPAGWIEAVSSRPPRYPVLQRRRGRPGGRLRHRGRGRSVGAGPPRARVPAPAHGPARRARRAPTWSPPTGRRPRSPRTRTVTRCSAPRGCWSSPARSRRPRCWTGTRRSRHGCWRWPARSPGRPALASADRVMAPIAPRRPATVAANLADRARPDPQLAAASGVRRPAARGRGPADARAGDQPDAGRRAGRPAGHDRLRRGRGPQGRRLRGHPRPAPRVRPRPGLRLAAGRAVHPRRRARRRAGRPAAGAGDPVPGLPAQRRRPDPRRGGHAVVLLPRPVPQPDGGARRGAGLPAGIRRALPQRQRARRPARHSRPDRRLPGPARRRGRHAAHLPGRGRTRRQRLRLPRAHRAVSRA